MVRPSLIVKILALVLLGASMVGCIPSSNSVDEQKESHYLSGRARASALDYKGAIEEFEKALEVNPRSSSAHLELGLLYEEHMQDFAAAIYHYERHLKLRPASEYTERAKDRIRACKSELVKTEYVAPVTQGMQRELERLMTENMLLKQRVESLDVQLNARPAQQTAVAPRTPVPQVVTLQENTTRTTTPVPPPERPAPTPPKARVHVVKSGDKLTTIARNYGVDLSKLMKANPGVDANRLRIGQTIQIP